MTIGIGLFVKSGVELYADRRTTFGTQILEQKKIDEAGKYHFIAAGYSAFRDVMYELLSKNPDFRRLRSLVNLKTWVPNDEPGAPQTVDVAALVTDGKKLWRFGGDITAYEITGPFAAIGSGAPIALGALHAGASAATAIGIAAQIDSSCGNGQDYVLVKPVGARKRK